jgi:hypothetical protein
MELQERRGATYRFWHLLPANELLRPNTAYHFNTACFVYKGKGWYFTGREKNPPFPSKGCFLIL